ncbi:hypothetical protein GAR05_05790 [Micromonospora saelicesensis]|uniref:Uncharacterized protein n=1 Tax=Micromonospora saelicesensis TaxID=285676 RepID=A0ABX9C9D8_9ACTN|nr:hypothetical protein [Micromonospora saelicesensis]RAN92303.1 hypothetical protein GAR05_05790 [Micromonospora saelicesensis]
MDVDNEERRAGAPAAAAGRRGRWKRFFERAPGLQLMAVYWVPMTVFIGLPVRWLFDRQEPLVEAVLNGALNLVWIGPAMYFSRWSAGEQAARRDPEGYALRQALRTSIVPADEATRTALPRYLAEQRRATWAALLAILGICLGLVLLALLVADSEGFAVIFGVVAAVSVAVAALTLTRIRRLETPGSRG